MPPWNNGVSPKYGVTQIYLRASNIRLRAAYADPVATCGYLWLPVATWPTLLLQLYVVGQPQTNCSVTSRPIQTGLCMPICLTTRKNDS